MGVVINIQGKVDANRDYLLLIDDIRGWEKRHGRIPKASIVLMYTGWGKYWGDRKRYFGTDEPGNVTDLHFPGFSREAAEFLIKERAVKAVGLDTPSIDYGPSKDFIAHQTLCGANVPIFENVAALDRLPAVGATIFALPMKIQGGSGGPLRIFALLP
jgi:kynurenine formamidase